MVIHDALARRSAGPPVLARWYEETVNFGDLITPFLIRRATGRAPVNLLHVHRGLNPRRHSFMRRATYVGLAQRLGLTDRPEYVLVGSILGWTDWKADVQVVWGAGFMDEAAALRHRPRRLLAVRGERTLAAIPRRWRDGLAALGDPGLIVGDMVEDRPAPAAERIGLVAHYTHKRAPLLAALAGRRDIAVIDVQQDVEAFVRALSACTVVVSSAMHGLIAADGLGLPTRWIRFDEGPLPAGGTFKFEDYFSLAGRPQAVPDAVRDAADTTAAARRAIRRDVAAAKAQLLASMPPFAGDGW